MRKPLSTREMSAAAIFAGITAVMAQISLPLPFTPVPVSMCLVAVYMAGLFLPPKTAVVSQLVYLLIGAVGLPVFSGFQGGVGRLLGPTGGYLLAYPLMVLVISLPLNRPGAEHARHNGSRLVQARAMLAVAASMAVLYAGGTLWLSYISAIPMQEAAKLAVLPFVLIDAFKVAATVVVFVPVRERFIRAGLMA